MFTNDPLVNSLLNRLAAAKAQLQELDSQRNELINDIASLEHVYSMYSGTAVTTPTTFSGLQQHDPMGLTNLTLGGGLAKIAEANNNLLIVVDAKRQLLASGKIKNAKNASSQIYSYLAKNPRFEKLGSGRFRLIAPTPPSANPLFDESRRS